MSVTTDWHLLESARTHMEAIGVDAREVLAVVERPAVRRQLPDGRTRLNAYGLTITVRGTDIVSVGLDGATADNWEDWARERAIFKDGANVPVLVEVKEEDEDSSELWSTSASAGYHHFKPRVRRPKPPSAPVKTGHVLDRIHPALRAEITRQVDGDFSRLVVHSPTNVEIIAVAE